MILSPERKKEHHRKGDENLPSQWRVKALYSPNVNGGKIIDHGIQQRLHPLFRYEEPHSAEQSVVNGCLAQSGGIPRR